MSDTVQIPPRRPDWRARLAAYLSGVAGMAFRPGRLDCALFAAGAVEAMTGLDLAAPWRGGYRSLADGQAALEAAGFSDHLDFVAAHFEAVVPAFAQVGDLAVMPGAAAPALGVVQGQSVYVLHPSGLAAASRLHMQGAFRV